MNGRDVLWQPGTDHAGIATQMVVERKLAEAQEPDRRTMGREAFLKRVWAWKAESGGAIVQQLKRLGASCDWSRERFTLDEGLSRAVAKVFVQLYRDGLIYKDKRLVNWDPKFQTAISDLEVVQVECRGSFKWSRDDGAPLDAAALAKVLAKNPNGHLYYFDYPVVDSNGEETGERVTVATTRPETMLGDTAVAVHPDDERYKHLIGRQVRLPLVGRLMTIVARRIFRSREGNGRGQDHAGARLQRLRGRQAPRGGRRAADQCAGRGGEGLPEGQSRLLRRRSRAITTMLGCSPRSTARTASSRACASSR